MILLHRYPADSRFMDQTSANSPHSPRSPTPPEFRGPQGNPGAPAGVPGISPEQLREFRLAEVRAKKIRRAATVAVTDGWIGAVLAAMAILSVCLDGSALFIGPALGAIAWNSFRGARRMRKFDRAAPGILAWNQVILAAVITLYCGWQLYAHLSGASMLSKELASAGLSERDFNAALGMDLPRFERLLYGGIYGMAIAGSLLFQGLTALYYFSRRKHLEAYLAETPGWVVDLQSAQIR
jgi:hypothetical protein